MDARGKFGEHARSVKPGSHLCDKHKHKHKHKLVTFPHVKQAQENMAYASAVTVGGDLEIFKMADEVLVLISRRFPLVK